MPGSMYTGCLPNLYPVTLCSAAISLITGPAWPAAAACRAAAKAEVAPVVPDHPAPG
jgi:hypothetical protein